MSVCARAALLGVIWSVALVTKRRGRWIGSEALHNNNLNVCTVWRTASEGFLLQPLLTHFMKTAVMEDWTCVTLWVEFEAQASIIQFYILLSWYISYSNCVILMSSLDIRHLEMKWIITKKVVMEIFVYILEKISLKYGYSLTTWFSDVSI